MSNHRILLLVIVLAISNIISACTVEEQKYHTELGDLIVWFMIDKSDNGPDWPMHSNSERINLFWNDEGVKTTNDGVMLVREGEAKLTVNGKTMWTLRAEKEDLNWDVTLKGTKFGVHKVEIWPNHQCFGTGSSGCDFAWDTLFENTESKNIIAKEVCTGGSLSNGGTLYELNYIGKQDVYVMYGYSSGSGGKTNWIEVWWKNIPVFENSENACNYLEDLFI